MMQMQDASLPRVRRAAPATGRPRVDPSRWLGALDALAPYLIASVAVAVARHAFASTRPAVVVVAVAVAALALGTLALFVRHMGDAHLTWPVACVLSLVVVPLVVMHVTIENHALAAPAAINLLPLAFTWAGLFVAICLIVGTVCTTSADQPAWAGVLLVPLALVTAVVPLLSLDPSRGRVLTAVLSVFAAAEILSGVVWLIPERRRWLILPIVLAAAALVIGQEYAATPHHFPGRALLLIDGALALVTAAATLGAPLLCAWLTGAKRAPSR